MPVRPATRVSLAAATAVLAALAGVLLVALQTSSGPLRVDAVETPPAGTASPIATVHATDVCSQSFDFSKQKENRQFDPSYTQVRDVLGIAVVAGPDVPSAALDAAEATIQRMFARNDLETRLADAGAYVIVAAPGQGILDLPEFTCLEQEFGQNFFTHVCGIADRADYPVATVNALDLLGDRQGPCQGVNVLYHEMGHLVHSWGLDPPDYIETRFLYNDAIKAGLYEGLYASTNVNEYFAEGTQAYFDAQDRQGDRNRTWLENYDPDLYALLESVYH